jgi:hypothetical protein
MSHPTKEQWMSYCYRESNARERAELAAHLRSCPQCAATMDAWQETRTDLNVFRLHRTRRAKGQIFMPMVLKWAAVIALLASVFGLGKWSSTSRNFEAFRAKLEPELRAEFRAEFSQLLQNEIEKTRGSMAAASDERAKELLKAFASETNARQKKELQALYAAMARIDSQRTSDYAVLKSELDALAINADAELRTTDQHLHELATFAQSTASPRD